MNQLFAQTLRQHHTLLNNAHLKEVETIIAEVFSRLLLLIIGDFHPIKFVKIECINILHKNF